ncbi:MAG: YrbL family protein [Sutterella parvirubra]|nr:YrbL family protein [Sutterella parvirubra]
MSKINWRTVSDEEINTWPILGRGGERVVRLDPNNPTQCVKLSSKTLAMQTEREADYLQELEDKGIRSKYVPRFYGCIETPTQIGVVVEAIVPGARFDTTEILSSYLHSIKDDPAALTEITNRLLEAKAEMIRHNIIVSDLGPANMMAVSKDRRVDVVLIDGFYVPEHIQLARRFRFFGRLKINRQWKKFDKRLRNLLILHESSADGHK